MVGLASLLDCLSAEELGLMIAKNGDFWRTASAKPTFSASLEMFRVFRSFISVDDISQNEVMGLLHDERPDLFRVLDSRAGQAWLARQLPVIRANLKKA